MGITFDNYISGFPIRFVSDFVCVWFEDIIVDMKIGFFMIITLCLEITPEPHSTWRVIFEILLFFWLPDFCWETKQYNCEGFINSRFITANGSTGAGRIKYFSDGCTNPKKEVPTNYCTNVSQNMYAHEANWAEKGWDASKNLSMDIDLLRLHVWDFFLRTTRTDATDRKYCYYRSVN